MSSPSLNHSVSPKAALPLGIIGWREIVALPQLNVKQIKAKIDTGARSSALHAFKIEEFELNNKLMIRFQIHPQQRDNKYIVTAEAELLEYRRVTSSGGHAQIRPVILTTVQLEQQQWQIELTLTNRDVMGFRMLLGRQALRDRFLVNPGKSFLQSSKNRQK
ncbi:MAG TPA: ATP-dependent zinc protease [Xenococcaceae cyanobacterium]